MTTEENKKTATHILSRDEQFVIRPWSGSGEPVPVVDAKGCNITDAHGKTFLDLTSGYFVNQAGHCHPKVIAATVEQLNKVVQVSGRHTTASVVDLAEKLVEISPDSVHKVFFATGGSEAVEFALKMVRQKTGKSDFASLENGFHGLTLGVLGACGSEKYRKTAGIDLPEQFTRLPSPYPYRCACDGDECTARCLDGVEEILAANPNIGAILAEPAQAAGGLIPSKAWWKRLDEIRKKLGLYLILDEIQTGIGRTGTWFAAEHYDLQPDIITVGKGVSGGVGSLAVVLASNELSCGFYAGTTPTNGGNAVSCAAGLALINVLEEEKLVENARAMGEYFTSAVRKLKDSWIGDVRFFGLLGGVELVSDIENKSPLAKGIVGAIKDHLYQAGMLITVSGPHGNVLRLQPPLSVTAEELDRFIVCLKAALSEIRAAQ
ncbi:MAG: aspartate aminotransferase family protein [Kofleriaceae bacterium]|nr:aspartate aminotransferase family protein [Kofleriaceae bacterium]